MQRGTACADAFDLEGTWPTRSPTFLPVISCSPRAWPLVSWQPEGPQRKTATDLGVAPSPPPESPQRFAFEARFGPYRPHIDDAFPQTKPYETVFGDSKGFYFGLEVDWQVLRIPKFGTLGPGIGWSYTRTSTTAKKQGSNDLSAEDTSLAIMPMYGVGVLRFDELARDTVVPLVAYAKAGIGYGLVVDGQRRGVASQGAHLGHPAGDRRDVAARLSRPARRHRARQRVGHQQQLHFFRVDERQPRRVRQVERPFGPQHRHQDLGHGPRLRDVAAGLTLTEVSAAAPAPFGLCGRVHLRKAIFSLSAGRAPDCGTQEITCSEKSAIELGVEGRIADLDLIEVALVAQEKPHHEGPRHKDCSDHGN